MKWGLLLSSTALMALASAIGCSTASKKEAAPLNLRFDVIELASTALLPGSLPERSVVAHPEPLNRRKTENFRAMVADLELGGDPVLSEVFGPFYGNRELRTVVALTSGVPAPYDAWTATYQGKPATFFNLSLWTPERLGRSGLAVIKHELSHVLLEPLLPKPAPGDPVAELEAIVVDEGIAHFAGYPGDRSKLLIERQEERAAAERTLENAITELRDPSTSKERKVELLRRANTGPYWEKYAAIAGMFRAGRIHSRDGAPGLIRAIKAGTLSGK